MAIFNLIPYKIRVLANPEHFSGPKKKIPFDIEGTCIQLNTHGQFQIDKMFKQGKVLELVFGDMDSADIWVRWDNDVKSLMYPGSMIHRSSNAAMCVSIWNPYPEHTFPRDDRHYSELHPQTWQPRSRLTTSFITTTGKVAYTSPPTAQPRTPSMPTMFKHVGEVPVGHPNAVIQDGPYYVRVRKYLNKQGQVHVDTEVLQNSREAMEQGMSRTNRSRSGHYSHNYGGAVPQTFPRTKHPKTPPLKKALWTDGSDEQIDLPTDIPVAIDIEAGPTRGYATNDRIVRTEYSATFENVVVRNGDYRAEPSDRYSQDDRVMPAPRPTKRPKKPGKKRKEQLVKDGFIHDLKAEARKVVDDPFKVPPSTGWISIETSREAPEKALPYANTNMWQSKKAEKKAKKKAHQVASKRLFDEF